MRVLSPVGLEMEAPDLLLKRGGGHHKWSFEEGELDEYEKCPDFHLRNVGKYAKDELPARSILQG